MRNSLDVPVVVRSTGDLGTALRVRKVGGQAGEVTRLTDGTDDVLMPGDVVRWPLGAGTAAVTVTGLDPAMIPAIVESLRTVLPRAGDEEAQAAAKREFGGLVRAAAGTIGRAVSVRLSRSSVADVVPVVLDGGRWDEWAAVRPAPVGPPVERTLRLASAPLPATVPPPFVVPSVPLPAPAPVPLPAAPAPHPAPATATTPVLPTPPAAPRWPAWEELADHFDRPAGDGAERGDGDGKDKDKDKGNGQGRGNGKDD